MRCCRCLVRTVVVLLTGIVASCAPNDTARKIVEAHNQINANPSAFFKPEHFAACKAKALKVEHAMTGTTFVRLTSPVRHYTERNCFWKKLASRNPVHGPVVYSLAVRAVVTKATGAWAPFRPAGYQMTIACIFDIRDGQPSLKFVQNEREIRRPNSEFARECDYKPGA